jgi:hypothetical protein
VSGFGWVVLWKWNNTSSTGHKFGLCEPSQSLHGRCQTVACSKGELFADSLEKMYAFVAVTDWDTVLASAKNCSRIGIANVHRWRQLSTGYCEQDV